MLIACLVHIAQTNQGASGPPLPVLDQARVERVAGFIALCNRAVRLPRERRGRTPSADSNRGGRSDLARARPT
jgi:hypothetical protein